MMVDDIINAFDDTCESLERIARDIRVLREQRDALVEALNLLVGSISQILEDETVHATIWKYVNETCGYSYECARAAIAAVEERR